ncbi:MAG: hypothetical protein CMJ18_13280 [Phycisphaeraceae bacterium]|nr:hypothetical protein [Phycisphaeraceae bacterium]
MGAIFGFSGPPDAALAQRMQAVLRHRGGGRASIHASPVGTIGHLAQLPVAQHRRMGSGTHQDGDRVIAIAGCVIAPRSDSLLLDLLALYDRHGPQFVERLRGAFVLAIRDGARLLLARDGSGSRTLYHGRHAGRLLFAIEPKGVLEVHGFPRRIRPAAIAQYLSFSFIPGPGTMLEDLFELPAGHFLTFDGAGEPTLTRYFRFEHAGGPRIGGDDAWVHRFRQQFSDAVAERMPEDDPVGIFLSGGLDSSVVTAEVARQRPGRVRTFAVHFGPEYPNELSFARSVAERCGTDHEEVLVRPRQFLPRLRKMIWHLDEPIGDPITMPNYELAGHVSKDVRWVFNGEGGDPCFGGPKNIPMLLHHWYGGIERDPNFRERMYLASYRRGYEEVMRLLAPSWRAQIEPDRDLEGVLVPYFRCREPANFLDKLSAINIRLKGAHLILPKVERMTGAWGIIPIAPLFDERLVRLSFEMPSRLKLSGGVEKVIIKKAYEHDLPAEIIARPKSGMRVPVHYWFRGELKRYARRILSRRALRRSGIFDEDRVQQLLRYNIEEGQGRYGLRLWMLITFEIWRRIVIDGEPV